MERPTTSVLVAYGRFPEADTNAGALRLLEIVRILRGAGHRVVFLAQRDNDARYRQTLEDIGVTCVCDQSEGLTESVSRFAKFVKSHNVRVAVLVHHHIYSRYAPFVRSCLPHCHCVLDTVDVHFLRAQREAALANDWQLVKEAEEIRRQEVAAIRDADSVWVVTLTEQEILQREVAGTRVPMHVVPTIHRLADQVPPYSSRQGIVFLGGYRHSPNVDAVNFFMHDVYPRLRRLTPDVPITIAGSHAPDEFRKYAEEGHVQVTGFVEDHRALLCRHRVGIAPLRFGAGMKGKIGEYFACGLPTVTTAIGAEGMGLRDGEQVVLAATACEFAEAVARVYLDESLWQRLSEAGRDHVRQHLEPSAVAPRVLEAVESTLPHRKRFAPAARKLLSRFSSPKRVVQFAGNVWDALRKGGISEFGAEVRVWLNDRRPEQ